MRAHDQRSKAIRLFRTRGLVRAKEFAAAGVTRATLERMSAAGALVRVSRGVYRQPAAPISEHSTLSEVQVRIPHAVICLLSALQYHGLTTQSPSGVWVALDRKARKPRLTSPAIEVVRFSGRLLEAGVKTHMIDGVPVRITSPARTVADCFRYRNKLGVDVAVEALRDYLRKGSGTHDDLVRTARLVGVANVMRPYLEALA